MDVILTLSFRLVTTAMTSDTTKPMKPVMMRMTPKVASDERRNPWKMRSTRMAAGMTRMVPTLNGDVGIWEHGKWEYRDMKYGDMGAWK